MDLFNVTYNVPLKTENAETEKLFSLGVLSVSRNADKTVVRLTALCEKPIMEIILKERQNLETAIDKIKEKDWVNEWVSDYREIDIQGIFSIIPHNSDIVSKNDSSIKIYIDPRDAFGAGTHPTTEICLLLLHGIMQKSLHPDALTMIDIGTGSGILAIAASLLGARSVDACDIDAASVTKARENSILNKCGNIDLFVSSIENLALNNTYDIVAANLQTWIIEQNFGTMKSLVNRDGYLVISGIDSRWKKDITKLIHDHDGKIINEKTKNGWEGFLITFNV
jgi:ribosomal protein L11 methyltransferase